MTANKRCSDIGSEKNYSESDDLVPICDGCRVRIDGGWGFNPQFPCSFHCDTLTHNLLVPAVLLTLPIHFSQFEPCLGVQNVMGERKIIVEICRLSI